MNPGRLTDGIRNESLKIGFAKTGFARSGKATHMAYFQDWICGVLHGEMRYLEKHAEKQRLMN